MIRDAAAKAGLGMGAGFLAANALAWAATGGFRAHVLGVGLQLNWVSRSAVVFLACAAVWMLLSPTGLERVVALLDGGSMAVHRRLAWAAGAALTAWLLVLKSWQHYVLQTSTYDLGLYASVLYNTAHGHPFHESIMDMDYLGDHFSPFFAVLAPVYRIFDNAAFLVVLQCLGLGLAAAAVYLLALELLPARWPAAPLTILFSTNVFVHRVSGFDFHPVALAIPLFLCMLLCVVRGQTTAALMLALFCGMLEESVLPVVFSCAAVLAVLRPRFRVAGAVLAAGALAVFFFAVHDWMPYFLHAPRLTHIARYSNLGGDSLGAIARNVIGHPWIVPLAMVTPPVKVACVVGLLASFSMLPLLAGGETLLLAIPVLLMNLSASSNEYLFLDQYSALALPFLVYCAVRGAARVMPEGLPHGWRLRLGGLVFLVLVGVNLQLCPEYVHPWSRAYVAGAHRLMAMIPDGASVCATDHLVPHLVNRERISMFGKQGRRLLDLRGADYVILEGETDPEHDVYPLKGADYGRAVRKLEALGEYALQARDGNVMLLRKVGTGK